MRSACALVAVIVALVLAAVATTPAAAAAARATYVGIVISGHGSYCVRWHSGITGDEVLNDVATVRYRASDGLIDQIDGQPSPPHADDTHYWSYWHDTGSSWQYSSAGASGSEPAVGSVEGWSYDNGSSSAGPPGQAPGGLYASLCGSRDESPPPVHPTTTAPTHAHTPTARATRPATAATGTADTRKGGTSTRSGNAQGHRSAMTGTTTAKPSALVSGDARSVSSTPETGSSTSRSGAAGGAVTAGFAPAAVAHKASESALPVILGIVLVLLLGGGAGWGVLRRRRIDADH